MDKDKKKKQKRGKKKDLSKDKIEMLDKKFNDRKLSSITEGDEDLNNEEIDEIDLGG